MGSQLSPEAGSPVYEVALRHSGTSQAEETLGKDMAETWSAGSDSTSPMIHTPGEPEAAA